MRKYPLIDIIKIICACLVTMIHMGTDPELTPIAHMIRSCFSLQAVPFFFITSGFFFAQKILGAEDKVKIVKNYSLKMAAFYTLWVLVQCPVLLGDYLALYRDASLVVLSGVLARRILLAGMGPFWYLLALSETSLIAGTLIIYKKEKALFALAVFGIALAYMYDANITYSVFGMLHKWIYTLFSWSNNFLMAGIPYFTIGILFYKFHKTILFNARKVLFVYMLVCAFNILIFYVDADYQKYFALHFLQSVLLFLIGLCVGNVSINNAFATACRNYSSAIYCLHTFVIIYFLGEVMPWSDYYIVNLCAVVIMCIFIYEISKLLRIKPVYRMLTFK